MHCVLRDSLISIGRYRFKYAITSFCCSGQLRSQPVRKSEAQPGVRSQRLHTAANLGGLNNLRDTHHVETRNHVQIPLDLSSVFRNEINSFHHLRVGRFYAFFYDHIVIRRSLSLFFSDFE